MSIQIQISDIVKLETDAIVNAANERLAQGSGVCGAIFAAAGPYEMNKACKVVGGCPTGDAVITSGFNLPSRYVIHAVGPKWNVGNHNEHSLLYGAYENSLKLALRYDLRTIASRSSQQASTAILLKRLGGLLLKLVSTLMNLIKIMNSTSLSQCLTARTRSSEDPYFMNCYLSEDPRS